MKSNIFKVFINVSQVKRQYIQFLVTLIALTLLVLGVGAPDNGGLVGH